MLIQNFYKYEKLHQKWEIYAKYTTVGQLLLRSINRIAIVPTQNIYKYNDLHKICEIYAKYDRITKLLLRYNPQKFADYF